MNTQPIDKQLLFIKRLIGICCLSILYLSVSTNICLSQPKFKPLSYDELAAPLIAAQQAFDEMSNKIDVLSEVLINILSQNIDDELRRQINSEYKKLNEVSNQLYKNGDVRYARYNYNTIYKNVNQQIVNYNNRVAQAKKKAEEALKRQIAAEEAQREALKKPTNWSGTGFALNNGYICTNYHIVDGAQYIGIKGIQGNFAISYSAKVIASDKQNDLAILKIDNSDFKGFGSIPYKVQTSMSDVGEDVFVLGYPLTSSMGDEIKLTTGVISSRTGYQGDVSLYQISAAIQPGNSGAPLFNHNGNIIGIVNSKHKYAENAGYAIKTSYLKNLIESSISTSILPNNNQIIGLPLAGKVKSAKDFIFLIECSESAEYASTNIPSNSRIIKNPSYYEKNDNNLALNRIILSETETILEFSCTNPLPNGWMNINPDAYIMVGTQKYKLTKAEGIAYSPLYTYFRYQYQTLDFKLHFPAIPETAISCQFIESASSPWKIFGIKLK